MTDEIEAWLNDCCYKDMECDMGTNAANNMIKLVALVRVYREANKNYSIFEGGDPLMGFARDAEEKAKEIVKCDS